jgi:anti-sigma-K factor RskA
MNGPSNDEQHLETTAALALGALSARESRDAFKHLATCADCRREYADLRPVADAVGLSAEEPVEAATSARMKARLMDAVRADIAGRAPAFVVPPPPIANDPIPINRAQARRSFAWVAYVAAAAGFVVALTSSVQNVGLHSELAETQKRVADITDQLKQTSTGEQLARTTLADVTAPDAKRYDVPQGTVIVHGGHAYLSLANLPTLPRGKVYEAWTLATTAKSLSEVKRSVTFSAVPKGTLVALPEDARNLAAVAVSVEPDGGSAKPTTTPILIRKLE